MPPTKGGVTTFMLNLMASDLAREFEFLPYTTARPPKRNVIDNWGYKAPLRGGWRRTLIGIALTLWRLMQFPFVLIGRRIDLVQIQASDYWVFWESAAYALLARGLGRPVMIRIGGAFDKFYRDAPGFFRRRIADTLRIPQCVIAQSPAARDYIRGTGRTGDIIVLPNWSHDVGADDKRRDESSAPGFLFIAGQEARRKGVEEVIEAIRGLDRTGCPARFHLVAMTPGLMDRVRALALDNVVAMEGPMERERLRALMRRLDVLLLPSHGEGFPNSLVEAMGAGMAAIVTPVGAVPEIVSDGGALMIPVGDAAALSGAIRQLASDRALLRRLGEEARKALRARFTAAAALPPLAEAYRRLLARVGPQARD